MGSTISAIGEGALKKAGAQYFAVFAMNRDEFCNAWNQCNSDGSCKTQVVLQYLTKFFGVHPLWNYFSDLCTCGINKVTSSLFGRELIEKESVWKASAISIGVYGVVDFFLDSWWAWVKNSTDCLKSGSCDFQSDDVLCWIQNMKLAHCDLESRMQCDGENCDELISTWCPLFFNEFPVIISLFGTGLCYLLLPSLIKWNRCPPGPPGNGGNFNDGSGNSAGSGSSETSGPETSSNGSSGTSSGQGGGTSSSTDNHQPGRDENSDPGQDKEPKPEDGPKDPGEYGTSYSDDEKNDFTQCERGLCKNKRCKYNCQKVLVSCPFCDKHKNATIVKPVPIYCHDCSREEDSRQGNGAKETSQGGAAPTANVWPLAFDFGLLLNQRSSSNLTGNQSPFSNVKDPVYFGSSQSVAGELSNDVQSEEAAGDDWDQLTDDQLYEMFMKIAVENKQTLDNVLRDHDH